MVFSTVQISMPGTSCAAALLDISAQGISDKDATKIIRPIIGPSSIAPKNAQNSQAVLPAPCQRGNRAKHIATAFGR
jgi:hypothetical protein